MRNLAQNLEWSRCGKIKAAKVLNEVRAFLLLEPIPSEADIRITRDIIRAGQILNIEVLDHIVSSQSWLFSVAPYNAELFGDSGGNLRHHLCFAFATRHYFAVTRIINQADGVLVPLHAYTGNVSPNIGFPLLDCSFVASS